MAEIRIPPVLRAEAAGSRIVVVEATNVRSALAALIAQHPALEARVLPNGDVPTFLNVFVDGEDIRLLGGLDAPLGGNSKVLLLPAVAGGCRNQDAS
jgi:molybdopterin converting factor small subunit